MDLHAPWQSDLSQNSCPSIKREEMMNKLTFDHIHLFTRDPEATAAFYERMFGAEVIRSMQEGKPRIDLKLGGANIFILDVSGNSKAGAGPAHPHQGLDHFGLQVRNIDAVCAELKSKGAVFSREPVTIRPGTRIAFVTGPDGVSIELLERTSIA
jgi:catechol 2,3-dioxygenase-like lactoylglutathione lyase family enzyme